MMHYTERQIAEDKALFDIQLAVAQLTGYLKAIHEIELDVCRRPDWSGQAANKYITKIESSCVQLRNIMNMEGK